MRAIVTTDDAFARKTRSATLRQVFASFVPNRVAADIRR